MSGIRLAAHLRERERASPRLLARALEDPQSIAALPDQQVGQLSLPAVAIKTRVGTFTVLFDRTDPRRRQRLRRLQLRPDPLRLEGRRRRRQAGAYAVVPAQRRGGSAANLEA